MKLIFRVDASLEIGTGHVTRCLTLADELARQGHHCSFICRVHSGHLGDLITSKGYPLTLLPALDEIQLAAIQSQGQKMAMIPPSFSPGKSCLYRYMSGLKAGVIRSNLSSLLWGMNPLSHPKG